MKRHCPKTQDKDKAVNTADVTKALVMVARELAGGKKKAKKRSRHGEDSESESSDDEGEARGPVHHGDHL